MSAIKICRTRQMGGDTVQNWKLTHGLCDMRELICNYSGLDGFRIFPKDRVARSKSYGNHFEMTP